MDRRHHHSASESRDSGPAKESVGVKLRAIVCNEGKKIGVFNAAFCSVHLYLSCISRRRLLNYTGTGSIATRLGWIISPSIAEKQHWRK